MVQVDHGTYAIIWVDPVHQLLVLVMLGQVRNVDKPQQLFWVNFVPFIYNWILLSMKEQYYFFSSCQNFIALSNRKQAIAKLSVQTKKVFIVCFRVNTQIFKVENCLFQMLNGLQTYLRATVIPIVAIFKTVWQLHQSSQKIQTTSSDWLTHSLNFEQLRKEQNEHLKMHINSVTHLFIWPLKPFKVWPDQSDFFIRKLSVCQNCC